MDNKGFTLVELLGVVVLLSLVMGIAAYGITNTINNSKNKSEEIFIGKLSGTIEEYINLNGSSLAEESSTKFNFNKCLVSECYDEESGTYIEGTYKQASAVKLVSIHINDLVNANFLDSASVVNPANKKKCFEGVNPEIQVFRDSDYVYYYYMDLSGSNTSCEISDDNAIVNTLPDNLATEVGLS